MVEYVLGKDEVTGSSPVLGSMAQEQSTLLLRHVLYYNDRSFLEGHRMHHDTMKQVLEVFLTLQVTKELPRQGSVSYTHLTLPTKRIV